jgi:hypothetical protein
LSSKFPNVTDDDQLALIETPQFQKGRAVAYQGPVHVAARKEDECFETSHGFIISGLWEQK